MSLATHRARTIGEIVDATFRLYQAHFATVITVAVIVVAPTALLKMVVPFEFAQVLEIIGNLVIPIAQGAITAVVVAAVERSETLSSGDALRGIGDQAGSLLAVQLASGLMVFIGLVLLLVPGVIAIAWTAVCVPVVVIERVGYTKAIDRSRALGRGQKGQVFGTLLLSWGIVLGASVGEGLVIGMLGAAGNRIADVLAELLFAVMLPIPTIAVTLLYYDLRVRTESADLDAMISALPAVAER